MGDFKVRKIKDAIDKAKMHQQVLKDIQVFEKMLKEGYLESGPPKIGAEQELCLVDQQSYPTTNALRLLDEINDEHYTNELALFNLEINLDPFSLGGRCFSQMEQSLLELLAKGQQVAKKHQTEFVLTGILPTLKLYHLEFEYMTPIQRYETLSNVLAEIRGDDFQIYLQGVDDFIQSLESVLFEACNTSFQLHLQMYPDNFVNQYNWSQMIAGPVLSACVNSPLVLGKELWAESRIALFKQSLDTRSTKNHLRKKIPRVHFGDNWLQGSAANIWKESTMRFPLLLTSDDFEDGEAALKSGEAPRLRAVQLHNGTTYTWNRLCYGRGGKKPHIRIECRYLPSGPSPVDEMANFAFWIGLMTAQPEDWEARCAALNFKLVKNNFMKAARYGLDTVFDWFGKKYAADALILEVLLPMAREGLKKYRIERAEIDKYLSIIEQRVKNKQTGADWIVKNYRTLQSGMSKATALKVLTKTIIEQQQKNLPVHQWDNFSENKPVSLPDLGGNEPLTIEELMSTDLQTIHEEDSVELARSLIQWKNIHHLPVENYQGELAGMITDGLIQRHISQNKEAHKDGPVFIRDIMIDDVISVDARESIGHVINLLHQHQLSGVPVTYKNKLIGIITENDLKIFI